MRPRQRPLELDRRGRRVAAGELHAGGEANAAVHRRQQIAEIGIQHGMMQHGIAARRQMQMVAALDVERDRIAERGKDQVGPRPHRHHDFARHQRAFERRQAPAVRRTCSSVRASPTRKRPPLRPEKRRIGLGQSAGIGDEARLPENVPRLRTLRSDWARAPRSPCASRTSPATPYGLARSKSRTAFASVASVRNSLIHPVRRNSSGTPASEISASCSIRLRRINGNSAIALASARSGDGCEIVARQPRQERRQIGDTVAHLRGAVHRVAEDLRRNPAGTCRERPTRIRSVHHCHNWSLRRQAHADRSGPHPGPAFAGAGRRRRRPCPPPGRDVGLQFRHPALRKFNVTRMRFRCLR